MDCWRSPSLMLWSMNIKSRGRKKIQVFYFLPSIACTALVSHRLLLSCLLSRLIPQSAEVCRLPRSSLASPHNLLWWSSKWAQHSVTQPVRDHRCVHPAGKTARHAKPQIIDFSATEPGHCAADGFILEIIGRGLSKMCSRQKMAADPRLKKQNNTTQKNDFFSPS